MNLVCRSGGLILMRFEQQDSHGMTMGAMSDPLQKAKRAAHLHPESLTLRAATFHLQHGSPQNDKIP